VVAIGSLGFAVAANPQGLASSDLSRLRSVGGVAASPDGKRVVHTVIMRDRPGRPYGQLWIMDLSTQKSVRVGGDKDGGGSGVWSPDSKWIAFSGHQGDKGGLFVLRLDGSEVTFLAEAHGTNSPLPGMGNEISWSPDSKQIAFVSSTPDPRAAEASGDPMVITRYLYKPDAGEGMTRFNDNQRLHIFVVDVATKQVRQLTQGDFDEHSVDWSPDGKKILFGSNREPNQDEFFNYDLFTLNVADGSIQRLTATEYNEYDAIWSPDGKQIAYRGTRRGITDRETTMEDTHVWVMNANGGSRREIGAVIDNRQGAPHWSADSGALYFTVQERGNNVLMRLPVSGGAAQYVVKERGGVFSFSVSKDGGLYYTYSSPSDLPQLYQKTGSGAPKKLTDLNAEVLAGKQLGEVESLTFISNDNKFEVEAFLTRPIGMTASSKHPLIVNIHGGPALKQFHYEVLNNARLSPLALMVTLFNALQGTNEYGEEITYKMNGQISVQGFPNVTLQNMFAPTDGGQPHSGSAAPVPIGKARVSSGTRPRDRVARHSRIACYRSGIPAAPRLDSNRFDGADFHDHFEPRRGCHLWAGAGLASSPAGRDDRSAREQPQRRPCQRRPIAQDRGWSRSRPRLCAAYRFGTHGAQLLGIAAH